MRCTDDVPLWPSPLTLEVMALAADAGLSSPSAHRLRTKFLGLTIQNIWHILCIYLTRPVILTFDVLTVTLVRNVARVMVSSCVLLILRLLVYDLLAIEPRRLRLITWPWPWPFTSEVMGIMAGAAGRCWYVGRTYYIWCSAVSPM